LFLFPRPAPPDLPVLASHAVSPRLRCRAALPLAFCPVFQTGSEGLNVRIPAARPSKELINHLPAILTEYCSLLQAWIFVIFQNYFSQRQSPQFLQLIELT